MNIREYFSKENNDARYHHFLIAAVPIVIWGVILHSLAAPGLIAIATFLFAGMVAITFAIHGVSQLVGRK